MKIKLSLLDKIFKEATAAEIDFLIYTLRFQNNSGVVQGIIPDVICNALNIHRSYFYHIIHSLEDKGIISVDWLTEGTVFWKFKMIDNLFWEDKDFKEGYINLNTRFLYNEEFFKLKKNEKIIMLTFLSLYRPNRASMVFTFDKIMQWTGRGLRSVKAYIKKLNDKFFSNKMIISDKKIIINTNSSDNIIVFGRLQDETDAYNEHELETILEENKAEADEETKKSVITMFKQFAKHGRDIIIDAILTCIKNQDRKVIAPYINTTINKLAAKRRAVIDGLHWLMGSNEGFIYI